MASLLFQGAVGKNDLALCWSQWLLQVQFTSILRKSLRWIEEHNWEDLCIQLKIDKHTLLVNLTKLRKVRFSIRFLHVFHYRFANATRVILLCISNR